MLNCRVASSRRRLVLIGPLDTGDRFVGGATISFRNWVDFVARSDVPCRVIDTRRFAGPLHTLRNLLWLLFQLTRQLPGARAVMLNGSRRGLIYLAPVVCALCRVFGADFYLRPFGGDFDEIVARAPRWMRPAIDRMLRGTHTLLLETPALMEHYTGRVSRTVWFPNARSRPEPRAPRSFGRRFVFLSSITIDKGAGFLLDAAERLDGSYVVDFFGPIVDEELGTRVRASGRYRGPVAPAQALATLREYDVLVLATFTPHEGLPGVIVEAFSIGMPVIATRWRAVPDLVEDGVSGLLVAPQSADDLVSAMRSIDETMFTRLSAGSLRAFYAFDSERVNRRVLDLLLG